MPWGCRAGVNQVKVITSSVGESNTESFKFIKPIPKFISLSPKSGEVDSQIEIIGKNFGEEDENSLILLNKIEAETTEWSNESITAIVPEMKVRKRGKIVPIKVKTTYGSSNTRKFRVKPTE